MAQQEKYPELRPPKISTTPQQPYVLSVHAEEFVPRTKKNPAAVQYQGQMPIHPSSQVHQRIAMAQGGVEQGGGDGSGGGGGGYEYTQIPQHVGATSNGSMMANGSDMGKMSALQNRLSNMQIVEGGDNGKEYTHHHQQQQQHHHHHHHHHNQQSMHHQHRGQQHPGGGHHGYHHHQQPQHQPYVYDIGYSNNHHVQPGGGVGMGGDHRKYNNGGGQHQQQYQHHRSRQQHHHHHQQQQQQPHQPHRQQHQQHQQQQQQQYGGNQHHDYMDGGGPAGYNMVVPNWDSNFQADPDQVSYQQMEAMDYLTEVIAELLDNPGMFDQVQLKLPDKLGELRHDHYVLSSTIEMIFEQSIRESNFRYMGARLCQLLDSLDGPNLRQLLRLKMEDQNNELPQFMSNEQVKVRGATLFLAELYMQLRMPEQSFGKIISEHIISAIETLLSKRGPENTKCVCQCLKLCGYELEQDCRDKVEAILKKLQEPQAVQSSTEAMIRSVLELRKNSWGRSEEIATAPAGLSNNLLPVFYGPDGKMLTEEESSFLATNIEAQGPSAYNNYDDDDEFGMVDPDDDPEVQEAYEQFIQSNAQSRLQQQQSAVRFQPDA